MTTTPTTAGQVSEPGLRRSAASSWSVTMAVGLVLLVAIYLHVPGIDGPHYFRWGWAGRGLEAHLRGPLVLFLPLALLLAACRKHAEGAWDTRFSLAAVSAVCFLGQMLTFAVRAGEFTFRDFPSAVMHNGYHATAVDLLGEPGWAAAFHELVPTFTLHASVHPPGPMVFHLLTLNLFVDQVPAAMAAGLLIAAVSASAPPAIFALGRALGFDRDASFYAAALAPLCPGFVIFFPMFDPMYVTLATATLAVWAAAIRRDRLALSVGFGLLLSLCLLMSYKLAVIGVSVVGLMLVAWRFAPGVRFVSLVKHCAAALATVAGVYAALYFATGFRPIASFLASVEVQNTQMLPSLDRHLPETIPWDLWDFLLGIGWLPAVLLAMAVWPDLRARRWTLVGGVGAVAVAQPVVVACTGLIQAETARCWLFMAPLVLLVAASVAAGWSVNRRLAFLGLMGAIVIALRANLAVL